MKEETKSQLDSLVKKYQQKVIEMAKNKKQKKIEEQNFINIFRQLKKNVINPTMKDIGNYLKSFDHDYHLHEQEGKITMEIFQAGIDRSSYTTYDTPSISFDLDEDTMKICVHTYTFIPGRRGPSGVEKYDIDQINVDLVERIILDVLKEILN